MKATTERKLGTLVLACVASLTLAACAGGRTAGEIADPAEGVNRGIFAFNEVVDTAVLRPVAKGYRAVVPQPARTGVRNFLRNLKTPTILANNLLQGDVKGAGTTLTRFVVNTLVGVGGLFDVAAKGGLAYREEDFGQTLGKWGAGSGPYLVLPILGPSSARDGVGLVVDTYTDPLRLWLMNTDKEEWYIGKVVLASVDKREALLDVLDDLKRNSIDYYAAMRSAYAQRRESEISNQGASGTGDLPDIP